MAQPCRRIALPSNRCPALTGRRTAAGATLSNESVANSKPRELSGRLWSWSGQLDGKPPRPSITSRIRLEAVVQIFWPTGCHRPVPVIGTREHPMTAPEHFSDVRSTSKPSSPSEQTDLAATLDSRPCASALGDAGRSPGQSGIRMTFQGLPGPNARLPPSDEGSYTLVGAVGFLILDRSKGAAGGKDR